MTKKILITGKNSYIGNQLADWLDKEPGKYEVIKESVRNNKWKEIDFSKFDVVVHVAGIAHIKETKNNRYLYYEINRDLAVDIAKKAKSEKVKQFIFLSSMSVYGLTEGVIDDKTPLKPTSAYGKSKKEAENEISKLENLKFLVTILRPPMIYGKKSKGNYQLLSKFAKKFPVFPDIDNQRSMLYIDNFTELVRLIIKNEESGLFFPQNREYIKTSFLVSKIAEVSNKKIYLIKSFNTIIFIIKKFQIINKVFGNFVYDMSLSEYKTNYRVKNLEQSIQETEKL